MADATCSRLPSLLADRGRRRHLRAGEVLFHENDSSRRVYECISGRLRLVIAAANGRELLLDLALPRDVFGELSAIDGQGRRTSAIAIVPSVVREVSGDEFLAAVKENPDFALESLRELARQLRRADARICAGETECVASRTAHLLLQLADRFAVKGAETCIEVPITQTDLAEWMGATREATARALAGLRRSGVISTARSRIVINDRAALADAVG